MTYRIRTEPFSDTPRADYDDISVRFVDGKLYPAVCVKVRGRMLDRAPADVRDAPEEVRSRAYERVRANWWEIVPTDLIAEHLEPIFRHRPIHHRADGRSDGWLVVCGIGTPDEWSETQRTAWKVFETAVEESIKQAERDWHEQVRDNMECRHTIGSCEVCCPSSEQDE